jgi:hypothetical protein
VLVEPAVRCRLPWDRHSMSATVALELGVVIGCPRSCRTCRTACRCLPSSAPRTATLRRSTRTAGRAAHPAGGSAQSLTDTASSTSRRLIRAARGHGSPIVPELELPIVGRRRGERQEVERGRVAGRAPLPLLDVLVNDAAAPAHSRPPQRPRVFPGGSRERRHRAARQAAGPGGGLIVCTPNAAGFAATACARCARR